MRRVCESYVGFFLFPYRRADVPDLTERDAGSDANPPLAQRCEKLKLPPSSRSSPGGGGASCLLAKFGFDTAENEPCKVCDVRASRVYSSQKNYGTASVASLRAFGYSFILRATLAISFARRSINADGDREERTSTIRSSKCLRYTRADHTFTSFFFGYVT